MSKNALSHVEEMEKFILYPGPDTDQSIKSKRLVIAHWPKIYHSTKLGSNPSMTF